jgi:hypothetical protein
MSHAIAINDHGVAPAAARLGRATTTRFSKIVLFRIRTWRHHLGDLDVPHGRLIEGRGDHLALHRALHVGDFLGPFMISQKQAAMAAAASEIGELRATCQALRDQLDRIRGSAQ